MKAATWGSAVILVLTSLFCAPALADRGASGSSKTAIAPDIIASKLWDGRKSVDFHSVSLPKMVRAADAHFLIDEEYVLGITGGGESRAYPTRFASWHHIINDVIGRKENGAQTYVTVTFCIVCNSGMRFETPLVEGKPLTFDFYGLYNGVMTMFDSQTKSVWLQVSGRAVKGTLTGTMLKPGPVLDTTWGEWKKLHPDTLVMAPDPKLKDSYEPKGSVMVRGYSQFPAWYFKPTLTHRDSRLPMFESVLAVSAPADAEQAGSENHCLRRAYPLKAFKGKTSVVNDTIGSTPVAVLFAGASETVTALTRVVGGMVLTFEVRKGPKGKPSFFDVETGSRWNLEGKSIEGPLVGEELPRMDSHMSQWYGWVSYFPDTSIYGQTSEQVQASAE